MITVSDSDLERAFCTYLAQTAGVLGRWLGSYYREYQFAPPRKWRFDFAWEADKVAVELEGGAWSGGRHTRGAGFEDDCEKYNEATRLGWRVLRFTGSMLERDPVGCIYIVTGMLTPVTAGG